MTDLILKDMHELVKMKEDKINGLCCAIDVFKSREKKVVRELGYLKSQYDSQVERLAIDKAIEIVMKIYEQV